MQFPVLTNICVYQDCLMGILRDKTIIYVTHQVEFVPAADLILVRILNTFVSINHIKNLGVLCK